MILLYYTFERTIFEPFISHVTNLTFFTLEAMFVLEAMILTLLRQSFQNVGMTIDIPQDV